MTYERLVMFGLHLCQNRIHLLIRQTVVIQAINNVLAEPGKAMPDGSAGQSLPQFNGFWTVWSEDMPIIVIQQSKLLIERFRMQQLRHGQHVDHQCTKQRPPTRP